MKYINGKEFTNKSVMIVIYPIKNPTPPPKPIMTKHQNPAKQMEHTIRKPKKMVKPANILAQEPLALRLMTTVRREPTTVKLLRRIGNVIKIIVYASITLPTPLAAYDAAYDESNNPINVCFKQMTKIIIHMDKAERIATDPTFLVQQHVLGSLFLPLIA